MVVVGWGHACPQCRHARVLVTERVMDAVRDDVSDREGVTEMDVVTLEDGEGDGSLNWISCRSNAPSPLAMPSWCS